MNAPAAARHWPHASGEMAARIRGHDWARTPLGPIEDWPQSLRTAVDIMLASPAPTSVVWGPDHIQLYNDPYIPVARERHPAALGRRALETWAEAHGVLAPIFEQILAGGSPVILDNQRIPLHRADGPGLEERAFAATFSAIRDERGGVGGIFHPLQETTTAMRALDALGASERKYGTLFDMMDEGFCILQMIFDAGGTPADYRFLEANPAFVQQSGLEDAVGRTARELRPELERHWYETYGQVALTGEPVRFVNHAESMGRWFDVYAFRYGDPAARQVAVLFSDITERKRQEAALQESRARMVQVFELSPAFLTVLQGAEHVVELTNPAYQQLIGHREVRGRSVREALPEVAEQGYFELLDEVYRTGAPFVGNELLVQVQRTTDAELEQRYVNFVYQPMRDSGGEVTGILVSGVDVTALVDARREIERTLAEAKSFASQRDAERQRLLTVLEQTPLAIAIVEPSGAINFRNAAFNQVAGYAPAELTAERYSEAYHGYDLDGRPLAAHEWPAARALRGEVVENAVFFVVHPGGRHLRVWANAAPICDAQGQITGAVVVTRDITAEHALEQQLRASQRLQAVGTLAGGVAHEINNQMTTVLGFGEFVLRALGPDHPQARDMRLVLNSAERTARISQQLLAFTRQQVTQPAILNLTELVAQLTPVLQQLLGTDKALMVPAPLTPLPLVSADRDQVEQVLINLVANARDATDTGARVTISLTEVTLHAELPAPPGDPVIPGLYVRLAVTDTGHGMSAATLERIFDPFFTTKDVGKGTGLGLSMVYGTLRRHGGYVRGQSAPGLGTTMELYWPLSAVSARDDHVGDAVPDSSVGQAGVRATSAPTSGPRTVVLLVEDEPTVRAVAARTLAEDGHDVVEARDGAAALEILEHGEVHPDLIVTDVVMPRLNGRQLHDAVEARWPQLPVLYISGHTGEAAVRERLVPVGAAFLGKPFTPGALQRAARELLRAGADRGGAVN